jgi:hypothetical protein
MMQTKRHLKTCLSVVGVVLGLLIGLVIAVLLVMHSWQDDLGAIPNGPFQRLIPPEQHFVGAQEPLEVSFIPAVQPPEHPFMAPGWGNNMHNDAYMSDTYRAGGPIGHNTRVASRTQGFGGYGTIAFDQAGRLVAVYSNARRFQLELMHPYTLEELASYDLPPRPLTFPLTGVMPWEYIGAGMYFYLDHLDRAVIPTTENTIQVVQTPAPGSAEGFKFVREFDLSDYVVALPWPQRDSVAWVLPDWNGEYYWFATTAGVVGMVHMESGAVRTIRLDGEIIENSFAVGEEGVFIISDQAMYRFNLGQDGEIMTNWRMQYDPGPGIKPGHITRGSGSSVTLMGAAEDGVVAVTDNAEPRVHLLFLRRSDGELLCSLPLFAEGHSGTDITAIGFEHAELNGAGTGIYSTIVENNWGHSRFPVARPVGGIERIDLIRLPDGSYTCERVWHSAEKNIGVFKLSLGNGLLYLYYKEDGPPLSERWYFSTVDFLTGETVYKQLIGSGIGYNNWAGAIFLHPDGEVAYSTTIFGLVMMADTDIPK